MKAINKTSVLLIDGEHMLAATVIRCLSARKNVRIHVLSSSAANPVRYSRHVTTFVPHCALTEDSLETVVRETVDRTGAELLLACSTPGVEFLIRRGQGIPNVRLMGLPSLQSFRSAADKWEFHLAADRCGADTPRTWLAGDGVLQKVAFPALLKPRAGEGGAGILHVNNAGELAGFLNSGEANPNDYIIQEFVAGRDLGCSVICRQERILAWTVQEALRQSESGFVPAWAVRFGSNQGAVEQAGKIVQHLNWTGVANFDMRIRASDGKVLLLEMNPRFWASIHGSLRAGIDFVGLNCGLAIQETETARQLDYYRGLKALGPWMRGRASDIGCRLRDPLPDLSLLAAVLKSRTFS